MQLYYREEGIGKPMVLLHGNGEDSSYFEGQIRYFSHSYHVYAIDTRGHGRSPRGIRPFTLKQFAKDLKGFLDREHLTKVVLLGFSDGGNIALIFTLMYPQYVKRLILNGANLNPFGVKLLPQVQICLGYAIVSAAAVGKRAAARIMERNNRHSGVTGECYEGSIEQKQELLGLMVKEPWIKPGRLRAISIPALVIAGDKDIIRESHTKLIYQMLPVSELIIMKGSHFIASENSREFNRAVEQFLLRAGNKKE